MEDTTSLHFTLGRQAAFVTQQLNAKEVVQTEAGQKVVREEFAKLRRRVLGDPVELASIREMDILVGAQLLLTMKGAPMTRRSRQGLWLLAIYSSTSGGRLFKHFRTTTTGSQCAAWQLLDSLLRVRRVIREKAKA